MSQLTHIKAFEKVIGEKTDYLYEVLKDIRQGKYNDKSLLDIYLLNENLEMEAKNVMSHMCNNPSLFRDYGSYFAEYFGLKKIVFDQLNVQIDNQIKGE